MTEHKCIQEQRLQTIERRWETNETKTQSLDREVGWIMQEIKNLTKSQDDMKNAMLDFIKEVRENFATKLELQEEIKLVKENKSTTGKLIAEWIKFLGVLATGVIGLSSIAMQVWKK